MQLNSTQLIDTLCLTGQILGRHAEAPSEDTAMQAHEYPEFSLAFEEIIVSEHQYNGWFTEEFIRISLAAISRMLQKDNLLKWTAQYPGIPLPPSRRRRVGVVMAGNIPLVGFHDFISVLFAGHTFIGKASSKDDHLIKKIAELITIIEPELDAQIHFTEDHLKEVDAIIATGSNNTFRYFEYYFKEIPHLLRKNRNGVAVITGSESKEELLGLGRDIFTYFGLGCRNVTKLYVPENYNLSLFLQPLESFIPFVNHHKYANNIDYHRSVYLMNKLEFLDNGALLLRESNEIASPVGVVYYEKYSEIEVLNAHLESKRDQLQCIVSADSNIANSIRPGSTQYPDLWDYADGVDTIEFLIQI